MEKGLSGGERILGGGEMTQQEVRQGHPYLMYDAIMRQPEATEEMLSKHANSVQPVAAELAKKRRIFIVGIGTSWHAALVAGHWFKKFAGCWPGGRGAAFIRVLCLPAGTWIRGRE